MRNLTAMSLKFLPACVMLAAATSVWGANYKVTAGNNIKSFQPGTLTITAGDTVTWENNDGGRHNVVANDGSFRCANGCDGEGGDGSPSTVAWSFTRTFTTPGTIGYYCEQHQSSAMSGTLIVKAAAATASSLENPQPGSFQSGIGLLSGWSCQGPTVSIAIDGQAPLGTPYGGARADTASICGASNTGTGFGLLFNFNTLSAGSHSAQLFINGQPQGASTQFTVTVPGGEFLTGLSKQVSVPDFPTAGRTTVLTWQQSQQNFAIQSVAP